jgi:hypothetical protein
MRCKSSNGDLFSSYNNLALKFRTSDFLVFIYFLCLIRKNMPRELLRIPREMRFFFPLSQEIVFPVPGETLFKLCTHIYCTQKMHLLTDCKELAKNIKSIFGSPSSGSISRILTGQAINRNFQSKQVQASNLAYFRINTWRVSLRTENTISLEKGNLIVISRDFPGFPRKCVFLLIRENK